MRRFNELDIFCEFGIGGNKPFERWLYSILPRAAEIVQKELVHPSNVSRLQNKLDFNPSGIGNIFLGNKHKPS
jgi:hypothetical protein